MKFFFLIIDCFSVLFGISQTITNNQFILTGIVHGRDTGYIILRYADDSNKVIRDTAYLQEGRLGFKGNINEPTRAIISGYKKIIDFDEVNYVDVFLEPTLQSIELTENDYAHARITGSFTQNEYDTFLIHIDSINRKYQSINQLFIAAKYELQNAKTDDEKKIARQKEELLTQKLNPKYNEIFNEDISFTRNHPNSYVSPFVFYTPANNLPIDSAKTLFESLSQKIRNTISGKYIGELLRKREQNTIGKTPYNFTAIDEYGNNVSLSNFHGEYLYIDFWASWCVPCLAEIPHIKELYKQYHSKGFDILTISMDKDTLAWKKAVINEGINNWHNVLLNKEIENNYPNVYNPIPSGMLISPDGKIIWKSGEKESLNDILKRLIK